MNNELITYWINTDYACGGVICNNDIVIEAAPIFKWMINKSFSTITRQLKNILEYEVIDKKKPKYYTGIGSRNAPNWALDIAYKLGKELVKYGYILRSGGADGMDTAFENGCIEADGKKEIYLPWKDFNNNKSPFYLIEEKGMLAAEMLHPNWEVLTNAIKKLHTRNVYQIVGYDWRHNSRFVICYTSWNRGGTLQALRLAKELGIKIVNLIDYDDSNNTFDKILDNVLIKKHKLKIKKNINLKQNKPFYCKLFNNYRKDDKCNEMTCEFCDGYYDSNKKQWWYHPESYSYIYDTIDRLKNSSEFGLLENVNDKIKTRVVNIKTEVYDIYIGRGSPYGNPFKIGIDGNRDEVIKKYHNYLINNSDLIKKIQNLKDKKLGCYCSPEPCHGDVIAEYLENN